MSEALFLAIVNNFTAANASTHLHEELECVLSFDQRNHRSLLVQVATRFNSVAVESEASARPDSFYLPDR
jgi:hypothetical protein